MKVIYTLTIKKILLAILGVLVFSFSLLADGTKQLRPTEADFGDLKLNKGFVTEQHSEGPIFGRPEENRWRIEVCDTTERIYIGMKFRDEGNGLSGLITYMRVKDSAGNIIYGGSGGVICPNPRPGYQDGFINTYSQAVTGPAELVGAGGYNAIVINPTIIGAYYIEFDYDLNDSIIVNGTTYKKRIRDFELFDVTVGKPSTGQVMEGRFWANIFVVTTKSFLNEFNGSVFIYSSDQLTTKINFNGIKPHVFTISANSYGITNTGNPALDRASVFGNQQGPEYKLFLTPPEITCFPTGFFGSLTAPTVIDGCTNGSFCINITVDKAGQVDVLLDLNGVPGYQSGTADRLLNATVAVGVNCVPWDGKDGLGNLVESDITVTVEVTYLNGITHLPIYDIEEHKNGFIVTPFRPAAAKVSLYWDDSTKLNASGPFPCGDAGLILGTINLDGCDDTINGCHAFPCNDETFNNGNGNNAGYGDKKTINTWWFVPTETNTDSFTYSVDFITIDFNPDDPNTLNGDTTLCWGPDDSLVAINVIVNKAQGGTFDLTNLNGIFSPGNSTTAGVFNGTYKPTAAEVASGKVIIKMTTFGNGDCPAVTDSMIVTFDLLPTVDAGANDTLCNDALPFQLNGSITNATTFEWSGGNGTFTPNNKTLNATYTPTSTEINNGQVTLYLVVFESVACGIIMDSVKLKINKKPTFSVLTSKNSICFNDSVQIIISGAPAGSNFLWTPAGSVSDPTEDTVYVSPSNTTTYTITVTSPEGCSASTTKKITVNSLPEVDAGPNFTICEGATVTLLGATSAARPTVIWTPFSNIEDPTKLQAKATPPVTTVYKLTVTDGAGCKSSDTTTVFVNPLPNVYAGEDTAICAGASVQLQASGAVTYKWTPTGSLSDANIPNPIATPTSSTTYRVTGTDVNGCKNTDDIRVDINALPIVTAQNLNSSGICAGDTAQLQANGATSYMWSPIATLTNSSIANPKAFPAVTTTYTVTGTDVNGCNNIATVQVPVNQLPNVDAGQDTFICLEDKYQLSASGASSYVWSPAGTLDNPNIADPAATPTVKTTYYVTGTDVNGCVNSDSIVIDV